MPSTFFGLTIASSGMSTAQAVLNTTGHNISNEKTTGYSRQVANQQATRALRAYAVHGMLGSGVEVTSITQERDRYYDLKYWDNNSLLGEQTAKNNYMLQIEDAFNEMTTEDSGFTAEYKEFFDALDTLSTDASNSVKRDAVVNYGASLADFLNNIHTALSKLQEDINTEVSNKVDQINTLSSQIAALNKQIATTEATGVAANDLRDRRAVLLDTLSGIVPITVKETTNANGKTDFSVKMEGYTLVDNDSAGSLTLVAREDKVNSTDIEGLYDVYTYYDPATGVGNKLNLSAFDSGELKALIDLRDGNNGVTDPSNPLSKAVNYKGLPYYISSLTDFITTFANAFNDVHQEGYDLYGNQGVTDFFIVDSNGYLSVNEDVVQDTSLIAASGIEIQNGKGDGAVAEKLYELEDAKLFKNANSSEYLQSMVSEIGISTKRASTFYTHYTSVKNTIANQRLSVSGVDADEEAMNLVKYQEAYNLSAKMVQTMSEIYDKLINETGV